MNAPLLCVSLVALQEPVGDGHAGRQGSGAAVLVERVQLRQAGGRIPAAQTLESTWTTTLDYVSRGVWGVNVRVWP